MAAALHASMGGGGSFERLKLLEGLICPTGKLQRDISITYEQEETPGARSRVPAEELRN
jgi:hypothetical protein